MLARCDESVGQPAHDCKLPRVPRGWVCASSRGASGSLRS